MRSILLELTARSRIEVEYVDQQWFAFIVGSSRAYFSSCLSNRHPPGAAQLSVTFPNDACLPVKTKNKGESACLVSMFGVHIIEGGARTGL